jgi:hypothetical protein
MPLELGADLALKLAGSVSQQSRKLLILDAEMHRYDKTLSDISGMDIGTHGNQTAEVIRNVRHWLNANRGKQSPLPGGTAIHDDYRAYLALAPDIAAGLRLDAPDRLSHTDYLHVVERALPRIEKARLSAKGSKR